MTASRSAVSGAVSRRPAPAAESRTVSGRLAPGIGTTTGERDDSRARATF
ncbi:hypothetical protein [Streptomyces fructofermentans]|nr:hypothetical protein [Streptomyces fructofermentans]